MINLDIPEHLRIGQAFWSFQVWLAKYHPEWARMLCRNEDPNDGLPNPYKSFPMTDIFNIPDEKLTEYWNEWKATLV